MLSSLHGANLIETLTDAVSPFSLVRVVALSLPIALFVAFVTRAEDRVVLGSFWIFVRPAGSWEPNFRKPGLPPNPLGERPWLDIAGATTGIHAAIEGIGTLLLGQGSLDVGIPCLAAMAPWLAVRGASSSKDPSRACCPDRAELAG